MITSVQLSGKHLHEVHANAYVIFCEKGKVHTQEIQALAGKFYTPLEEIIKHRAFTGSAGSQLVITASDTGRPVYLMLFGIGSLQKKQEDRLEAARRAIGSMIRAAEAVKIKKITLQFPEAEWFEVDAFTLTKELVATIEMAAYHFDGYITDSARRHNRNFEITLVASSDGAQALAHDAITVGIEFGRRIGFAVNQARQWCDLPANMLTPTVLGEHAARIANAHGLKATIFDKKQMQEMGMGGILAVSKGSAEEPRLVVIEYKTDTKNAPTIALVGKGITFDSGGISIKPSARMDEMKDDMAGAAAVISTMEALAHLKPHINVIAFAPIAENMPSGTATRPGDIIQFYNGKTAEVKNTDAEGRLVLADALSYAIKNYKLDAIINAATLTGSCAYALGPFFCGLMSQHDALAEAVRAAGMRSGDRAWPLPFHDDYKPAVVSKVADLCNQGSDVYRAGAITAGFFLQNFVGDVPWVHLDIAGTSFNVPDVSYYRPGATGFGVRMFIELCTSWQ